MRQLRSVSIIGFLISLGVMGCFAWPSAGRTANDPLPRAGSLGAPLSMQDGHVIIAAVLPSSSAQQAGLRPGDFLLRIDGARVRTTLDAITLLHRPAGVIVICVVQRNGAELTIPIKLLATPRETGPHVATLYSSVLVDGTLRRILVDVPRRKTGRLPALMLVGGIGCYPIDTANPSDPYRNISRDISARGFVTLRLEKSGMRDSQGPPCKTVDFATEMHSYDVALNWLLHSSLVDAAHVYLLGHSIGGIIVPQLVMHNRRVAGVIVADTVGINWFEYELINERRQLALAGESDQEIDKDLKVKEVCTHWLEIDRRSYESILSQRPDCKQFLDVYPVPASYMQQVAALNIAESWHHVRKPVLVIYGLSDFITDEDDHKRIVGIVNKTQPGDASLVTIADMDHYLVVSPSQQASFDRAARNPLGTYNRQFSESIIRWLCGRESCF
jgi:pimeloyl-ACP methyl ester carboxylesterase